MTNEARKTLAIAQTRGLLTRVLGEPELVAAVRALPPRALAALVDRVGLEDSGELVALAAAEQLVGVLDADLWRNEEAGEDERLDAARFAAWLEILLEAGDQRAVDKIVDLPEELVTHGFFEQALVLDMDELAAEIAELDEDDVDAIEKSLDGCLSHEIDGYRVISRRHDGWDAVVAVLVELDARHPAYLRRLFDRLAAATASLVDDHGGLSEALGDAEMLASDAAAERDDRRSRAGYVAPSDARAFLALAKKLTPEEVLDQKERDPITRAYFRELERTPAGVGSPDVAARPLLALLDDGEEKLAAAKLLGTGATASDGAFAAAMRALAREAPAVHAERLEELAFLVNVVTASESTQERRLRPLDAVERVMSGCGRGLDHLVRLRSTPRKRVPATKVLTDLGCDRLFRIGYGLAARRPQR